MPPEAAEVHVGGALAIAQGVEGLVLNDAQYANVARLVRALPLSGNLKVRTPFRRRHGSIGGELEVGQVAGLDAGDGCP